MTSTRTAFLVRFCGDQIKLYALKKQAGSNLEDLAVFEIQGRRPDDALQAAEAIRDYLLKSGYQQESIVVGLDCFQALLVSLEESEADSHSGHQQLEIMLEASCPVDAENMLAASLKNQKYVVAIRDRVEPLIDVLRRASFNVQAVVPTSMLIAQTLVRRKLVPDNCSLRVADGHIEQIGLEQGRVVEWRFAATLPKPWSVKDSANVGLTTELPHFATGTFEETDLIADEQLVDENWLTTLAGGIEDLIQERFDPPIANFSVLCQTIKHSPRQRAAMWVGASVAMLLAAITISNVFQDLHINQATRRLDDNVASLYSETIPDASPTRLMERALKAKCESLVKQTELLKQTAVTDRITTSLYAVLKSMPRANPDIELQTLQLAGQKMVIGGKVTRLANLDLLKSKIEAFGFELIQAEQQYGLTFRLSYRLPEEFSDVRGQP